MFDILVTGVKVDAKTVRCPLLVVAGRDDKLTPVPTGRRVARKYGGQYREYAGRGHMLIIEPNWEEVAGDVIDWLDRTILAKRSGVSRSFGEAIERHLSVRTWSDFGGRQCRRGDGHSEPIYP